MKPVRPPRPEVLRTFGVSADEMTLLPGEGGRTFRSGPVVLKFVGRAVDERMVAWQASLFRDLPRAEFRVPRLIATTSGPWLYEGWIAMEWLPGTSARDRWSEKVAACRAFHAAIAGTARPAFFHPDNGPWERADRAAWGEETVDVDRRFRVLVGRLADAAQPLALPCQLIHGDLSRGNLLFDPVDPPGVLDFAPYWRPAGFALAIMAVDEIAWNGEKEELLDDIDGVEGWAQLVLRAVIRRIIGLQELASDYPGWDWTATAALFRPVAHAVLRRLGDPSDHEHTGQPSPIQRPTDQPKDRR